MEDLTLHGYVKTAAVDSIGKIQTLEVDGPSQVGGFYWLGQKGVGYPNATVLAQTWNVELALEMGRTAGAEAGQLGYDAWYAPGLNLHRTPVGGRNYEYYSEDTFLTGTMGSQVVRGSLESGVTCYAKHLICNEQDTLRDGLYTWMTEQALRETYLRPFQMAVRQGGLNAMMTAYNRLGAVWAGGSQGLLQGVVRDEWGFQGAILTDYSDHMDYMNMTQALRAGGDLWMDGVLCNGTYLYDTQSTPFRQALREASRHILYTWLNTASVNQEYNQTADAPIEKPVKVALMPMSTRILLAVDGVTALGVALVLIRWYHIRRKSRQ